MIVAAGLTPAWQQILTFKFFRLGEVNRAEEAHACASGKVLNVALALAHLGAEVEAVALVGGPVAIAIDDEFAHFGIRRRWVRAERPTRTCTTILDRSGNVTTELVENAGLVSEAELTLFVEAFAAAASEAEFVVLTGSMPLGTPTDYYRTLLRHTPARAILDVRGPELLLALEQRPFLIKPNREELAATVGHQVDDEASLRSAMRELNDRGAEWVVVSGGAGLLWAANGDGCYRLRPPTVKVVNPIASGDCLAAGIAWASLAGEPPLEAIRIGMAAAADNVSQLLPARLDAARVRELAAKVIIE